MAILESLGVNGTYFIQLAVFICVFFILRAIYFRPFLKLFNARYEKTVLDRKAAEDLMAQAQHKLEKYNATLKEARTAARHEYDAIIAKAKQEEAEILSKARAQVKEMSQELAGQAAKTRADLRKALEAEVDTLAEVVSQRVLLKRD